MELQKLGQYEQIMPWPSPSVLIWNFVLNVFFAFLAVVIKRIDEVAFYHTFFFCGSASQMPSSMLSNFNVLQAQFLLRFI